MGAGEDEDYCLHEESLTSYTSSIFYPNNLMPSCHHHNQNNFDIFIGLYKSSLHLSFLSLALCRIWLAVRH